MLVFSPQSLAKEIVRSRQAVTRLHENRAQLNSISMHLGESVGMMLHKFFHFDAIGHTKLFLLKFLILGANILFEKRYGLTFFLYIIVHAWDSNSNE